MNIPEFLSEFAPGDVPVIAHNSKPMEHPPLNDALSALPIEKRMEEAYALILEAVYSYYFAKALDADLARLALERPGPLASGLREVRASTVKNAVMAIAKTIDEATGRTKSLPLALRAMQKSIEESPENPHTSETHATIHLIDHIWQLTNPDRAKSLLYVRHVRNKWSGHASWDADEDHWPTGDSTLNFPLLEDGLVRMVNAFDEFGVLLSMSSYLQTLEKTAQHSTGNSAGGTSGRISISWQAAVPMAHTMRDVAQEGARQFLVELR
ncbi:hypothetical protein [Paenarthrobacter sp. NPDC091669]|uniref:hypothetical protein n=1 Tax=Paenarthrobacter sp. NPDC091669 TaxID=3364384 RepID=UPI0037FB06A0